jgi:hypothetical protein
MWGALSDERTGLTLQLLLAVASAVILESESRGTRNYILLSQIRGFPFCRLLRLAVLRWRYSTPPPREITALAEVKFKVKVKGLLMWGALSDERTSLSFARVTVSTNT